MKILESRYPLGSIPRQRTAGRYIDGTLCENIRILAKHIVEDMTFLGIISSSTLEVGTGKSVFVQQLGEAYLEAVREYHGVDNKLTMQNICFRPKALIEQSFKVPKYSCVILDEWEDAHYWSELAMSLRQFFRKCRQLNLFILVIIPNFFQLPPSYAISRSIFFIDVKFGNEFERGHFSFYNFKSKKDLYVLGKKTQNYNVVAPDFSGNFLDGYVVDEKEYRKAKYDDMIKAEDDMNKPLAMVKREWEVEICKRFKKNVPKITNVELSKGFGVNIRTVGRWLENNFHEGIGNGATYNNNPIKENEKVTDEVVEDEMVEDEADMIENK